MKRHGKTACETLTGSATEAPAVLRRPRPYLSDHRRLEVYHGKLDPNSPEKALFIDPLRAYAEATIEKVKIPVDMQLAETLISREDAIDKDAVLERMKFQMEPVLIARDFFGRGFDEMVDGNHTYVACALAMSIRGREGKHSAGFEPGVPAILIPREVWRDFRAVREGQRYEPLDGRKIGRRLKRVRHDIPIDFALAGTPRSRQRKRTRSE